MTDDAPQHVLVPQGEGFFSKGTCTGCGWEYKGHIDEVTRVWKKYHKNADNVVPLPERVTLPSLLPDQPYAARLEKRIIELLTHHIDFQNAQALYVAHGLAEARHFYLKTQAPVSTTGAADYIATLMGRLAHMSARQREKLRHPACTREQQQKIMEQS